MGPNRPYLLRAFYEWLRDNECTPHLVVNATLAGVQVPVEHIKDGQIVLNIAPHSVGNFEMGNERVTFSARFGGKPHQLIIPMAAVIAIYARENGAGTMFEDEDFYLQTEDTAADAEFGLANDHIELVESTVEAAPVAGAPSKAPTKKNRSFLTVVK